jgi:hypothetical protein
LARALLIPSPVTSHTRLAAAEILAQASSGRPPSFGPRFAVLEGPDSGRVLPLCEGDTVGRSGAAQVALRDPAASRRHARIERDGSDLAIVDLGSKNGVELNGRRVASRATLRDGDRLRVGATLLEAAGFARRAAPGDARGEQRAPRGAALLHRVLGPRVGAGVTEHGGASLQLRAGAALLLLAGAALVAAAL